MSCDPVACGAEVTQLERHLLKMISAADALIADVRRRYPGEELRCPFMIKLDDESAMAKALFV